MSGVQKRVARSEARPEENRLSRYALSCLHLLLSSFSLLCSTDLNESSGRFESETRHDDSWAMCAFLRAFHCEQHRMAAVVKRSKGDESSVRYRKNECPKCQKRSAELQFAPADLMSDLAGSLHCRYS